MDATRRIKNLSIALEALSRIVKAEVAYMHVENVLMEEIREFQKEKEKETQWPQRGPAKPAVYDKDPYAKDDDIPF